MVVIQGNRRRLFPAKLMLLKAPERVATFPQVDGIKKKTQDNYAGKLVGALNQENIGLFLSK